MRHDGREAFVVKHDLHTCRQCGLQPTGEGLYPSHIFRRPIVHLLGQPHDDPLQWFACGIGHDVAHCLGTGHRRQPAGCDLQRVGDGQPRTLCAVVHG